MSRRLPTLRRALARVQFRLMLLTIALMMLGSIAVGAVVVGSYVRQELGLVGRLAAYDVAPAIVFRDAAAGATALEPLAGSNGVRRIEIAAPGLSMAVNHPAAGGMLDGLLHRITIRLWREPVREPIVHDGERLGEVRIYAGLNGLGWYLAVAGIGALACVPLALLVAHLIALHLHRRIAQPLGAIADIAHRAAADHALYLRAPAAPIHEIDSLGRDFNAMMGALEGWQAHLQRENEALAHRVAHDSLTGLANRSALEEHVAAAVRLTAGTGLRFALLYIDADRFKDVNDRHGHAAGDALLVAIATRLRAALRRADLAARIGGDEFAVLVGASDGAPDLDEVVARIEQSVCRPMALGEGIEMTPAISIGAALYPDDGTDVATLFAAADRSMYAIKQRGRPSAIPAPTPAPSYRPGE